MFSASQILLEDHHLIVVNKPAPLLTQAPAGVPSLEQFVKDYLKEKYSKPAGVYLGVPHRLDRPVSGVILFARSTKAAQRMQLQFEGRMVRKVYWAIVAGHLEPDTGTWQDYLRKVPDEARVEKAEAAQDGAKEANLTYRVLHRFEQSTLLELTPTTGRTHQLRVQCAWRGHPILGETLYTDAPQQFGPVATDPREQVMALHARQLEFEHPTLRERMTINAELPAYWPEVATHFAL